MLITEEAFGETYMFAFFLHLLAAKFMICKSEKCGLIQHIYIYIYIYIHIIIEIVNASRSNFTSRAE